MKTLFFLVYDGIENSVFDGQVIQPILIKLNTNLDLTCTIISFEKNQNIDISTYKNIHPQLTIKIYKKIPFISIFSLWFAAWQIKKFIHAHTSYSLIARGPLAGWIAQAVTSKNCTDLIIQARGLAAEEYRFSHQHARGIKKLWHTFRKKQYERIERYVYSNQSNYNPDKKFVFFPFILWFDTIFFILFKKSLTTNGKEISTPPFALSVERSETYRRVSHPDTTNGNCTIEVVSNALGEYLCTTFKTNPSQIMLAKDDIPSPIDEHLKIKWAHAIRTNLGINDNVVYVYNGSAKPWQCPEMVIEYFKKQFEQDRKSFLLILSQDIKIFETLCMQAQLPEKSYKIAHVSHTVIYQYLACAHYGMLFRSSDIINWVSRPTKLLEYKALNLPVIHNNTIAYAIELDAHTLASK